MESHRSINNNNSIPVFSGEHYSSEGQPAVSESLLEKSQSIFDGLKNWNDKQNLDDGNQYGGGGYVNYHGELSEIVDVSPKSKDGGHPVSQPGVPKTEEHPNQYVSPEQSEGLSKRENFWKNSSDRTYGATSTQNSTSLDKILLIESLGTEKVLNSMAHKKAQKKGFQKFMSSVPKFFLNILIVAILLGAAVVSFIFIAWPVGVFFLLLGLGGAVYLLYRRYTRGESVEPPPSRRNTAVSVF